MFINAIQHKGLINKDYLVTFLKPLLRLKEWDETITLKELYEKTNINLSFYATRLDNFILSVFNHLTEPNMPVLTAIYMSATLPPLLQPMKWNNIPYIDGGVIAPNPIHECISNTNSSNEVLTFKLIYKDEQFDFEKANIFTYLQKIITNLVTFTQVEHIDTPHQIIVEFNNLYKLSYTDYLKDKELRKKSIEEGYTSTK
jgi:predicted acylesterase/phospholipase RssA